MVYMIDDDMKKIIFKNNRNKNLVGDFYKADSDTVVIMSHGFAENRVKFSLFSDIARDLHKNNLNVFTFDFCGCGESDDENLTIGNKIDDLQSAISLMKSKKFTKIILLGYSLGGLISLRSYSKDILSMVLMAPVTNKIEYSLNKRFSEKHLEELRTKGKITLKVKDDVRKEIVLDKQLIEERNNIIQEELLKDIKCPTLIVHGDEDLIIPCTNSKSAINLLNENSKLEIIKSANHRFTGKENLVRKKIIEWIV